MDQPRPDSAPSASDNAPQLLPLRGDRREDIPPGLAPQETPHSLNSCLTYHIECVLRGYAAPALRIPLLLTSVQRRFLAKIDTTGDCWLWKGCKRGLHYGGVSKGGYAHRWAYQQFIGPIPDGQSVLHHCDTPLCVNPAHLFLGTQTDNIRDKVGKGRVANGERLPQAKLTEAIIAEARRLKKAGASNPELAIRFGVAEITIWRALTGRSWKHVT